MKASAIWLISTWETHAIQPNLTIYTMNNIGQRDDFFKASAIWLISARETHESQPNLTIYTMDNKGQRDDFYFQKEKRFQNSSKEIEI